MIALGRADVIGAAVKVKSSTDLAYYGSDKGLSLPVDVIYSTLIGHFIKHGKVALEIEFRNETCRHSCKQSIKWGLETSD